jgi:hypothetical protein
MHLQVETIALFEVPEVALVVALLDEQPHLVVA